MGVFFALWLRYFYVCFVNCITPLIFFVLSIFVMPESPRVLVIKGMSSIVSRELTDYIED